MNALRNFALFPVIVYRKVVSPAIPERCKYYPSCSHYAVQAVREYGILRGTVLASWRVLRCNPFSHGGVDHVAAQSIFKTRS